MGEGKNKIQVCRHCGNEKSRTEHNGRYSYFCHCLAWREYMKVLAYARAKEKKSDVYLRKVSRRERLRVGPFVRIDRPLRGLQAAGGLS